MPLFDYICLKCGLVERDVLENLSAPPLPCEDCQEPMKRLPGAPNAHFRGSGFYQTDYKEKGK